MKLVIFTLMFACAAAVLTEPDLHDWETFKLAHNKMYESAEEEAVRNNIHQSNVDFIVAHNNAASRGLKTFTLKMNHYGDMTLAEAHSSMGHQADVNELNLKKEKAAPRNLNFNDLFDIIFQHTSHSIPKEKDWRKEGIVTHVKTQGSCASDWAFSAIGALESAYARKMNLKNGNLVAFSEQQLIDCTYYFGNLGCYAGLSWLSYWYIAQNSINTEASYPYVSQNTSSRPEDFSMNACAYNPKAKGNVNLFPFSWKNLNIEIINEDELTTAIANVGPVVVAINALSPEFLFYSSGIYAVDNCDPFTLSLSVLAVGYGVDEHKTGLGYYILKNSQGTQWGEKGYMKIYRGNNFNMCGVATSPLYPHVSNGGLNC